MYADSPSRVEFAYAVVRDTLRKIGGGTDADQHYKNIIGPLCPNHYQMITL